MSEQPETRPPPEGKREPHAPPKRGTGGWFPASRRLKRLRTAVDVRGVRVQRSGPGVEAIREHIVRAEAAVDRRRVNEGWGHLHEAERLEVALLTEDELQALVVDLRAEAKHSKKFGTWRRRAILDHLGGDEGGPAKACDVQHALKIRSEHFDNVYSKIDETAFWVLVGCASIAVLLATLLVGLLRGWLDLTQDMDVLAVVMLMGALGAALSTTLTLVMSGPEKKSIPDLLKEGRVNMFRPLLGAGMATVTYVFVQAGLLDFLGENITTNPWLLASFGFIAGYSERWFVGIVGRITEEKASKDDRPEEAEPEDDKPKDG